MQQMALRCNRVRCAATTGSAAVCGTRCTVTIGRCAALQTLQPLATGACPWQRSGRRCIRLQQLRHRKVRCRLWHTLHGCRCCCAAWLSPQQLANGLRSVASGRRSVATAVRCGATDSASVHHVVARNLQQVRLRHSRLHCNKRSDDLFCNRIIRCCNTRRAVATDCTLVQQCCVVELSAVATRDAPSQRMGNRVGCVVARTG